MTISQKLLIFLSGRLELKLTLVRKKVFFYLLTIREEQTIQVKLLIQLNSFVAKNILKWIQKFKLLPFSIWSL